MTSQFGVSAGRGRSDSSPSGRLIAFALLGGVCLILGLNYLFTIGGERIDYGDLFSSTRAEPFIRQVFLPHLTIAILTIVALTRYRMWGEIRLNLPRGRHGWVIAIATIAAVVSVIDFSYFGEGGGPWGGFAALLAFAMVGINEELLFRGFGLAGFTRLYGLKRALLLSSSLFGLAHASNLFLGQSLRSTIGQVVATTIMGLLFGLFALLTRSLIAPMILHGVWDFMLVSRSGESELASSLGTASPSQLLICFLLACALTGCVSLRYVLTGKSPRRLLPVRGG